MLYGICNLSIASLRLEPTDQSELTSQVLYGEHFKVLEKRKKWSKVRIAYDKFEGWLNNNQYIEISEDQYKKLDKDDIPLSSDLVEFIENKSKELIPIVLGSSLSNLDLLDCSYDGNTTIGKLKKENLLNTAFLYLNAPFLNGGKTPFGIDCSGFTQMVYKLNGHKLKREASQQATQGEALSFIEESEPGDLAFFDNTDGEIIHVGIIMKDNYIIHAHGKVRIDRLDHSGIYNADKKEHTHKLRVIKKII